MTTMKTNFLFELNSRWSVLLFVVFFFITAPSILYSPVLLLHNDQVTSKVAFGSSWELRDEN